MSDLTDLIALRVSRDQRFQRLQEAIAVEADQRDNVTIRALLAAVRADAELAMAEFAEASPTDTRLVSALAVRVGAYTRIKRYLETILTRGKLAEAEIRQQDVQYEDDAIADVDNLMINGTHA